MSHPYRSALIVGSSGGIGQALSQTLQANLPACEITGLGRRTDPAIDLTDEASIAGAAASLAGKAPFDLIIVATGLLHDGPANISPEKTWRQLDAAALTRYFAVNAIGPALVAKHFLPHLDKDRRAVFAALSARVGSISDNRLGGWYGYRASKAALNQVIKCLAIELKRTHKQAICAGLHPGTVATALSEPFRGSAKNIISPEQSAANLLAVIDGLGIEQSGSFFAWDGVEIVP